MQLHRPANDLGVGPLDRKSGDAVATPFQIDKNELDNSSATISRPMVASRSLDSVEFPPVKPPTPKFGHARIFSSER